MWPPLAYGIDVLGIIAGIALLFSLAGIAFIVGSLIFPH
jgi:hypothetical protein